MNNKLIERMVALRRDGFTMKAIAAKVGVSERTVRRYVRGVEPNIKMPSELNSDEFMAASYDLVLAHRRGLVAAASESWDEPFEFGFDRVNDAMKELRELLAGMEKVSVRRLETDEALRAEFFREFLRNLAREWAAELNTIRQWRRFQEAADLGESGPEV